MREEQTVMSVFLELGQRPDEPGPPINGLKTYPADVATRLTAEAQQIIARYPSARSALLPLLHLVQSEDGCLTPAGIAFCVPLRRAFENRLGDFLGWISYPLYLVQAPVIYAFSVGGLHHLVAIGFDDAAARVIAGTATVPVAILCAIAFCPINDLAVKLSRRTGRAFLALLDALTYSRGSTARGAAPPI